MVNIKRRFGFNVKLVKSLLKDIQALQRHKHYYILINNKVKIDEFDVEINILKDKIEFLCK